jgi:hypothetical protein
VLVTKHIEATVATSREFTPTKRHNLVKRAILRDPILHATSYI